MVAMIKSRTVPIQWLPFNWDEVAYFTEIEGGFWVSVHAYKPAEIHAVLLNNDERWDCISGYTGWLRPVS